MTAAVAPVAAAPASPAPTTGAAAPTSPTGDATAKPVDGAVSPKPAAKPLTEAQKIKLRLQGKKGVQEREYTPAELERELQIAEHDRTQRAQFLEERKAYDARMKKLAESPDEFFQEAGIDVEQILAQRQQRAEQMKALSPEQQENLRLKEQLAKIQSDQKKAADAAEAQRVQQEDAEFVQGNARLFGETMRLVGLDKGSAFDRGSYLSSMTAVRQMALMKGEPDLTPEQLAHHTERFENMQWAKVAGRKLKNPEWVAKNGDDVKEMLNVMFPEDAAPELALQLFGPKRLMAIVKAVHGKTRTSPVPIVQEPPPVAQSNGAPRPGAPTRDEWDVLDSLTG